VELKRESAILESKKHELESMGAKRLELDRLVQQAIQLAGEFEDAYAIGTIQEKRLLVRGFVKEIVLDPETGTGRTAFEVLPGTGQVTLQSCLLEAG